MNDTSQQKKQQKGASKKSKKQKQNKGSQKPQNNSGNQKGKKAQKKAKKQGSHRPAELTDIIKSITENLKKREPPSSWAVLNKFDENEFDYSVVSLGQQIHSGRILSMTDAYVKLLHSLDACFGLTPVTKTQMEFLKRVQSKINTTKHILYEFIKESEVFNNIFEHFQTLARNLLKSTHSVFEMKTKLREHVREYIAEKFINSDTLLIKYAKRFLRANEKVLIFSPNTIILQFLLSMRRQNLQFEVFLIEDGKSERNRKVIELLHNSGIKVGANGRSCTDCSAASATISDPSTRSCWAVTASTRTGTCRPLAAPRPSGCWRLGSGFRCMCSSRPTSSVTKRR